MEGGRGGDVFGGGGGGVVVVGGRGVACFWGVGELLL